MASTASLQIQGIISGLPEGQQRVSIPLTNSTSAGGLVSVSSVTTGSSVAVPLVLAADTRFLLIQPPTTNTFPLRLCGSTGDLGVQLSSVNPSLMSVVPASTVYLYTTGGTTFSGVRYVQY